MFGANPTFYLTQAGDDDPPRFLNVQSYEMTKKNYDLEEEKAKECVCVERAKHAFFLPGAGDKQNATNTASLQPAATVVYNKSSVCQ
jgi:hypothetical protein